MVILGQKYINLIIWNTETKKPYLNDMNNLDDNSFSKENAIEQSSRHHFVFSQKRKRRP